MSIRKNLERTAAAVAVDSFNGGDLADRISAAAVEAIMKGIGTHEWEKYMALFCDTKEELAQLTVVRETDNDYMPKMRAYIVANAVCAADTGTQTANGVNASVEPPAGFAAPVGTDEPEALRQELGFSIPEVPAELALAASASAESASAESASAK